MFLFTSAWISWLSTGTSCYRNQHNSITDCLWKTAPRVFSFTEHYQWWCVTKYMYTSTPRKLHFEVLVLLYVLFEYFLFMHSFLSTINSWLHILLFIHVSFVAFFWLINNLAQSNLVNQELDLEALLEMEHSWTDGPTLNVVFSNNNQQILLIIPLSKGSEYYFHHFHKPERCNLNISTYTLRKTSHSTGTGSSCA